MGTITSSQLISLIDKDVHRYITAGYGAKSIWNRITQQHTMDSRYTKTAAIIDTGFVSEKLEGAVIPTDAPRQGPTKTYVARTFALGTRATYEMLQDQEVEKILGLGKALGRSARKSIEYQVADLYAQSFVTTTYTNGTGGAICSTSNTFGSDTIVTRIGPSPLNYANFMTALHTLQNQNDGTGSHGGYGFGKVLLIVPLELASQADAIVNSQGRPGTADNDRNYVRANVNVEVIASPQLSSSSSTAWWVVDADRHDLSYYKRMPISTFNATDHDTLDAKYAVVYRHALGANMPQGIVGNQGA